MKGKIAFEEHVAIEETLGQTRSFAGESGRWEAFTQELLDTDTMRIEAMDKTGIEFALLSINAPGVQGILDTNEAIEVAKKGNDRLADAVAKNPKRYAGLAALPMQDPDAASKELTRAVKELGFKGCMVNGFQQTVSELDVPFYLHPRMQISSQAHNYEGHPWLMSAPWGFAIETSIHSLRFCGSGMFDDFPNLRIVIGHLGENIPFALWRVDARMRFSPRGYRGKRPLGEYFLEHFHITTSGFFNDPAFRCTLEVMGTDRMYFSADYPFERMEDAADWYDATPTIADSDKLRIGRTNAIRLFDLDME